MCDTTFLLLKKYRVEYIHFLTDERCNYKNKRNEFNDTGSERKNPRGNRCTLKQY